MSDAQAPQVLHIVGLHKPMVDPDTEAAITFFALASYSVRLLNGAGAQAVLQGYTSQSAYSNGKRPLAHIAVDFPVTPQGDAAQWFYEHTAAKEDGPLAGATPVLGEPAQAAPVTAGSAAHMPAPPLGAPLPVEMAGA